MAVESVNLRPSTTDARRTGRIMPIVSQVVDIEFSKLR